MQEIEIMKTLDHENVIRMHEMIDDDEDLNLFIVIDYAAKRQLMQFDTESGMYINPNDKIFEANSISQGKHEIN